MNPQSNSDIFGGTVADAILSLNALEPPVEIMWMPDFSPDGPKRWAVPRKMIKSTPEIAALANKQLQELRARAAANKGPWPWLDLNHDKSTLLARVVEMFWSDAPGEKGIRASVEWEPVVSKYVLNGTLVSFSPGFARDSAGNFLGITANCGGVLSRLKEPSLERMQPIKPVTRRENLARRNLRFITLLCERSDGMTLDEARVELQAVRPELFRANKFMEAIEAETKRLPLGAHKRANQSK